MILKETDSKAGQLAELEALMAAPGVPPEKKLQIERELKILRAGIKGERDSAYDIDFYSGASKNRIVIHDLRLELNGRVAQIDHLVLNRLLEVYVLETKTEVVAAPAAPRTVVAEPVEGPASVTEDSTGKLTTSKLAQKIGLKTADLVERLVTLGLLELREGKPYITPKGKEAGGEFRMSKKFGPYFLWPEALKV